MLEVNPLNFYLCWSSLAPFCWNGYLTFVKGVTAIIIVDLTSFFWILVLLEVFEKASRWSSQLQPRRQFLCWALATDSWFQCCSYSVEQECQRCKTTRLGQSPSFHDASLKASIRVIDTSFRRLIQPNLFIDYWAPISAHFHKYYGLLSDKTNTRRYYLARWYLSLQCLLAAAEVIGSLPFLTLFDHSVPKLMRTWIGPLLALGTASRFCMFDLIIAEILRWIGLKPCGVSLRTDSDSFTVVFRLDGPTAYYYYIIKR